MKKYKNGKVVMLPTNKKALPVDTLFINAPLWDKNKLHLEKCERVTRHGHSWSGSGIKTDIQHIYVTCDEDIKPGDSIYESDLNSINIAGNDYQKNDTDFKIIATSDPELGIDLVSDKFLKVYVESNGKINDILIEYVSVAKIKDDSRLIYAGYELPIRKLYMTHQKDLGLITDGTKEYYLGLENTGFPDSHGYTYTCINELEFEYVKDKLNITNGSVVIRKVKDVTKDSLLKSIVDRKNDLKSKLATLKQPKMDKVLNEDRIQEIEIRIDELEFLEDKI